MMRLALLAAVAAGAWLAGCTPAPVTYGPVDPERILAVGAEPEAQSCALNRRGSVSLVMGALPMVAATINGRPATLVLDTGAESTILNVGAARRLGVTTKYDFARSMRGIGEAVNTGDAKLDSMDLGSVPLVFPRALVGPILLNLGGAEPDGLLGASLLSAFDLDIDLPNRRLDLYDRTECSSLRPPWEGRYSTLETTRSLSAHPFFTMTVNGQPITASLDTGAQRTVLSAPAAERLGIGTGTRIAGPVVRARGAAGETLPAAFHSLRNVRVGDVPLRTPVLVTPVTLPRDIDALLGADFLQSHRIWLSYGSRRLFVGS